MKRGERYEVPIKVNQSNRGVRSLRKSLPGHTHSDDYPHVSVTILDVLTVILRNGERGKHRLGCEISTVKRVTKCTPFSLHVENQ